MAGSTSRLVSKTVDGGDAEVDAELRSHGSAGADADPAFVRRMSEWLAGTDRLLVRPRNGHAQVLGARCR